MQVHFGQPSSLKDSSESKPQSKPKPIPISKPNSTTTTKSSNSKTDPNKPKKTKSRNGCLTCKKKRLKCGEEKPFCQNCVKKSIVCGGYSMNFKWKDFSQTTASQKMSRDSSSITPKNTTSTKAGHKLTHSHSSVNNPIIVSNDLSTTPSPPATTTTTSTKGTATTRRASIATPQTSSATSNSKSEFLKKALEAATLSVTGKSSQEIAIANALIASGKNPDLANAIASSVSGFANTFEEDHLAKQQRSASSDHEDEKTEKNKSLAISTEQDLTHHTAIAGTGTISPSSLSKAPGSSTDEKTSSQNGSDNSTKPERKKSGITTSVKLEMELQPSLEEESIDTSQTDVLSSLAEVASKVHNSATVGTAPLSPYHIPSPGDLFYHSFNQSKKFIVNPSHTQNIKQEDSVTSPLNLFKDILTAKSPPPFTHANPLYDILNNSATNNGQVDSPKLMQQLNDNPAAMEQYQSILNSPALNNFLKFPFSPGGAPSPLPMTSSDNTNQNNHVNNPSLSTLISAFSNFENLPSPGNFELNPPTPGALTTKQNTDDNGKQPQSTENEVIAPNSLLEAQTPEASSAVITVNQQQSSLSPISHSFQQFMNQLPKSIHISDHTMRMLSAFDRYTCGILSIKNGPTENPWRTVLLPLSQQYPVMLNAVSAMTCFHVARGDPTLRSSGMKHMKNAIMDLVHGLSDKSIPLEVALATCLVLANGEAWDRHVSTGIAHLKGARTMINQLLNNLSNSSNAIEEVGNNSDESDSNATIVMMSRSSSMSSEISLNSQRTKIPKRLHFLFNAWIYFDVLARMTSIEDCNEDNNDVAQQIIKIECSKTGSDESDSSGGSSGDRPRSKKRKVSTSGNNNNNNKKPDPFMLIEKFNSFDLAEGDDIDPLLGVAQGLFPIIGKVATLISKVRKSETNNTNGKKKHKNSLSIISKAAELKSELETWKPPILKKLIIEDPLFDLASAIATAEAYRFATLLYLHQAVPELPSHSSHSIAEKILMLFASIPTSSRTCVTHIYPLLIASCEAQPGEEREWVREKWELLSNKMWIGNIDRALEVVKEVWSRKDILKAKKEQELSLSSSVSPENHNDEDKDGFYNLTRRINRAVNASNDDYDLDEVEENRLHSWTHWTTIMKEWGWEVLLA